MEKLFIRISIVLFLCQTSMAQDMLYVYNTKGTSLLEIDNKQSTLKKGHSIGNKTTVKVLPSSEFTSIDSNGNVYLVNTIGTYKLNQLLNFKAEKNSSSFTSRYFKHIWEELMQKENNNTLIAGVIRGQTLMQFPKDSTQIASSKITFKWDYNDEIDLYYVFIKNNMTDEILKIETNGSQLALYRDNAIFFESNSFKWTVSSDAFPNLDNILFYSFNLIDRNQYQEQKKEYVGFIDDLKRLNHTEKEIETILCETYGLCK